MAKRIHLYLDQGATFSNVVSLTNDDGTVLSTNGYSSRGQIRKSYHSTMNVYTINTSLTDNILTMSITADQTAKIPAGRHVFDIELYNGSNNVLRVLQGTITINPEVTK